MFLPHCYRISSSCCLKAVCLLFFCRMFLKPIILLFSVGTLGYLHRLPLYYKSLVYYCLGSVVKSPVLYFSYPLQSTSFTLLFVRRSAVSRLRFSSSQRHRLAFFSCSKSRTHRLDGDTCSVCVLGSEGYWQLCVVDPSLLPINLGLEGHEPWVSENGFVFSQVGEEESKCGVLCSHLYLKISEVL
jgi:hypothetical protein